MRSPVPFASAAMLIASPAALRNELAPAAFTTQPLTGRIMGAFTERFGASRVATAALTVLGK